MAPLNPIPCLLLSGMLQIIAILHSAFPWDEEIVSELLRDS